MNANPCDGQNSADHIGLFPATHWTQVTSARDADISTAMEAMDSLARAYWQPLYVLARRQSLNHEEAADVVQGFLAKLLTREGMQRIEHRETRFRAFLGTAFRNWLSNERRREGRHKRGGGAEILPMDEFESLRASAIDESATPEQAFDRQWARSVYDRTMARLCAAQNDCGRPDYFAALRDVALGRKNRGAFEEIADRFGVTASALRKAASDLRTRFGKLLRKEVERVVSAPSEVDSELRYLLQLLTKD